MIVLTATLASIGTPGTPAAGIITLAMVLKSINVPLEGIALILGPDRILDMCRTVVNITGDASCAVVVADNEGKKAESTLSKIIVCDTACPICSGATQTSFVTQLRGDVPLDIGIVYWMCLASPRTSFYIPFHFGISDFPSGFAAGSVQRPSEELYKAVVESPFRPDAMRAFWTFSNFHNKVEAAGAETIALVKSRALQIEENAFAVQNSLEQAARSLYTRDRPAAAQMLTDYSRGVYLSAIEAADEVLSRE